MSKNYELLRRAQGHGEILPPAPVRFSVPLTRPGEHPPDVVREEHSDWQRAITVLYRQRKAVIAFAVATFVIVAIVTFSMKPLYEPAARIEIDPPGSEIFSMEGAAAGSGDSEYLQTQAQKLQSDELALEVIRSLRLDQNSDLVKQTASSVPASPNDLEAATPLENSALKTFRQRVAVNRDSSSRLITASFGSHDPRLSAIVTNKIIELFIEDSYRTRRDAIAKSTEWLSKQLDDIRLKMDASNRALADLQRANGIADTGENKNTVAEEMVELNRQLTQAEADRIQVQAFLARQKEASPDTLPQVNSNPVIQQLTQKLADVRAELALSEVIYGKNHPNIKKLENQAKALETQITAQRAAIVGELKTSYAAARAREQMMGEQIKARTQELNQMARYNELKKEAQANTDLYNSLYAKIKEAGIAAASKSSNIRIVDRAQILDSPTRPHRALNLATGFFVGLLGGIVLAFVREGFNRRIHSAADVRTLVGITGVAMVPAMGAWKQSRLLGSSRTTVKARLFEDPYSAEAEALRGVQASILVGHGGRVPQIVLVVSSSPGEGATSIAVALARALAQHSKVCLIDTHLRKPGIQSALGLDSGRGLTDILSGAAFPEQVIVTDSGNPNLTVLLAGSVRVEPASALSCLAMRKLLLDLRQQHDFIILDSPPALPFADVRILSPLADGIVLVGRSGFTTRDAMARTKEILAEAQGAPILNIVLNGVESRPDLLRSNLLIQ